jgi:hypothetical protein
VEKKLLMFFAGKRRSRKGGEVGKSGSPEVRKDGESERLGVQKDGKFNIWEGGKSKKQNAYHNCNYYGYDCDRGNGYSFTFL